MKLTIESTPKLVEVNGVPARLWEGTSDTGVPVHCFITRVAVPMGAPADALARFAAELTEHRAPSEAVAAIPLRLVL